ncbi:hypothetical protein N752_22415 [Desulforamulus aquiferis]|nr:hypothetical protein [Desulforamulus aquiferis]RYD02943.1 hypothetical protein N752_22415 [Desulforamulus aquiferis]
MKIKKITRALSIGMMLIGIGIIAHLSFSPGILPAWNPATFLEGEDGDHMWVK